MTLATKFKPLEDLNSGKWNKDKFRQYTINHGRYEGVLFYIAERETSHSTSDRPKEKAKAPIDVENNIPEEKATPYPAPRIDFSTMPSYQSIRDDGPDLKQLYSFLREKRVVTNADEDLFIKYVTHAFFSPLYLEGSRINILYVIRRLKDESTLKSRLPDHY